METDPFIVAYRKLLPPPIAELAIRNREAQVLSNRYHSRYLTRETCCVSEGFDWYETTQSDDFWYAVHDALEYEGRQFPSMKTLR